MEKRIVNEYWSKNKLALDDIPKLFYKYHKRILDGLVEDYRQTGRYPKIEGKESSTSVTIYGYANLYKLSKDLVPSSKLKYNYVMLDSNNAIMNNDRDQFQWNIQDNIGLVHGLINLHSIMRNIKMARLGRITFANLPPGDIANRLLGRHRIGYGFKEFASQALLTPSGLKLQFIQIVNQADNDPKNAIVTSGFFMNRGWFRFRSPFKMIDSLTLSIHDLFDDTKLALPSGPIVVDGGQDVTGGFVALPDGSFLQYPLQSAIDYYIENGEVVTFSGFTTADTVADAVLIANYNTTHAVNYAIGDSTDMHPAPLPNIQMATGTYGLVTTVTVHMTLNRYPRFTGVLELISEDDNDIDDEF